jgi:hypothetical protein
VSANLYSFFQAELLIFRQNAALRSPSNLSKRVSAKREGPFLPRPFIEAAEA